MSNGGDQALSSERRVWVGGSARRTGQGNEGRRDCSEIHLLRSHGGLDRSGGIYGAWKGAGGSIRALEFF